jgi:hypothetical protein
MQRIEKYRHRAEVVAAAAADASAEYSDLLAHLAEQWRCLAEHVYGLSVGNRVAPIPAVRPEA